MTRSRPSQSPPRESPPRRLPTRRGKTANEREGKSLAGRSVTSEENGRNSGPRAGLRPLNRGGRRKNGSKLALGRARARVPRAAVVALLAVLIVSLDGSRTVWARDVPAQVTDPAPAGGGDGVHGRLRGDMSFRGSVGAELSFASHHVRPLVVAEWVGYQTLGVYAAYREALPAKDPLERALSAGVTFSPLFLWRFSRANQTGRPVWDLLVDSLGLTGGVLLQQPRDARFASAVGAEFGGTLALPLMGRANGLWLRSRVLAQSGGGALGHNPWGAVGWLTLTWEGFFYAGILKTRNP